MGKLNGNATTFVVCKQVRGEWKIAVWNLKNRETKSEVVTSILHAANETYCMALREALSFAISKYANQISTCLPCSFFRWQSQRHMWIV